MKYSFAELGQNIFTRKFGGTTVGVADPYLTGYHFVWFDKIPTALPGVIAESGGNSEISASAEIQTILAASCTGVTPPGGTLNKVDFTGLGGSKWAVPGNVDYGDTVSLKFIEFSKTPLLDIMHSWVKMIRDYRTGTTDLIDQDSGIGYTKKTYSALMYYWTTAPDGVTVEYSACYDGVFPLKDPQDLFASDVETVGRLDIDIDFNVDYAWHEKWVREKCSRLATTFAQARETVKGYGEKQA